MRIFFKKCLHYFLLFFIFILSACTVGPNYVRPAVNIPAQFKEAKKPTGIPHSDYKDWKKVTPEVHCDRNEWWKVFRDEELNRLEIQLNHSNQNIKTAYYNYQHSLALVDQARAAYFPTVSGAVSYIRQKQNSNSSAAVITSTPNSTSNASSSNTTNTTSATSTTAATSSGSITRNYIWLLSASWEPDIWGTVSRTVEADQASANANAALLAATRLSMQGSLAQFYLQLRMLDAAQALLNKTVKGYKKAFHLVKNKYRAGVDATSDVVQAQLQLENAEVTAINNEVLRAQYEHAIAVLIGVPPAEFKINVHAKTVILPHVPVSVPSVLLEQRPDIVQAEYLMMQANAQIGVAVSAYYPVLTLTGDASTVSKKLFSVPLLFWSLGAQLADTLIDFGARAAQVRAAEANYQATVATYRQTILAAFQNVEDNLSTLRILNRQAGAQEHAVVSANKALRIASNQYRAGIIDYSNVIIAETAAFVAQQNALNLKYLRLVTTVNLITAMGGQWPDEVT